MKSEEINEITLDRPGKICLSKDLLAGGLGLRLEVKDINEKIWPAFVVRHSNGVSAYLNRCSHLALELDWEAGQFFDIDGEHLICATHGALYSSKSGECAGGPCNGIGLQPMVVDEQEGMIYLKDPVYRLHRVDI